MAAAYIPTSGRLLTFRPARPARQRGDFVHGVSGVRRVPAGYRPRYLYPYVTSSTTAGGVATGSRPGPALC